MGNVVSVEVTDPKYRVLKHEPTGVGFDADGKSQWPQDQFTLRLVEEGSVRIVDAENRPEPSTAPVAKTPDTDALRKEK